MLFGWEPCPFVGSNSQSSIPSINYSSITPILQQTELLITSTTQSSAANKSIRTVFMLKLEKGHKLKRLSMMSFINNFQTALFLHWHMTLNRKASFHLHTYSKNLLFNKNSNGELIRTLCLGRQKWSPSMRKRISRKSR